MKILIAPLNWGLGHATRCDQLIRQYICQGDEVVLAGDGESGLWLRLRYPGLRYIELAHLQLHYSHNVSQTWTLFKQLPHIIHWCVQDHVGLAAILAQEHFDLIISDNRFGFYNSQVKCIYITHQLHICLPKYWQWAEPIAEHIHRAIYRHYNEVWVPDTDGIAHPSLSGHLGHLQQIPTTPIIRYIGPLSRFANISYPDITLSTEWDIVALLSGLEPQRTLLEEAIIRQYIQSKYTVLIIRGKTGEPKTQWLHSNITIVPTMDDAHLRKALLKAKKIIARSGYSTIMDLHILGILHKVEFRPTPGQSEQAYLANTIFRLQENTQRRAR